MKKVPFKAPDFIVQKVYGHVTPDGHGDKLVDDLKSLKSR